ncbi:MAG TPA: hypothetical protein EYQ42_03010 [Thiotrichaceae bacterium]|jgi:uncharacterized membrane protein YfcA|nr:hypothetical protein [Thiotrichaceae bacterium]HIM08420.1 hypothetical protein [Gammaproteobacteria bacterium]
MSDLKQIERLYSHSYLSYIATFFAAILAFWFFQSVADPVILNSWFIIFTLLTIIRIVISWRFYKYEHNNTEQWLTSFLVLSLISGTLWGFTGFLFVPDGVLSLLDSVLYHGMLLLFIAALITGSIITYSASKAVYLSFAVPAVVPQCLMLIAKGDKYHSFLGGFVLAYACIIFVISVYIHRIFLVSSKIDEQNEKFKELLDDNGISFSQKIS